MKNNNLLEDVYKDLNLKTDKSVGYDEDEYAPFVNALKVNKTNFGNAFGIKGDDYDELARRAAATALAETGGGDDTYPFYLTDKLGLGSTQGISQINKDVIFNSPGISKKLKSLNITKDNYDPWDSRHAAAATIALLKDNEYIQRKNAKIKGNKADLSDAELGYYQWNQPGVLRKGEAQGESEKVKRFMDYYNKLSVKQEGGTNKTKLSKKDEILFNEFYKTLPDNLRQDDSVYDIRGYWDSEGRPANFNYDQPKNKDGSYHAYSINSNTGEYLKSPVHPTFRQAIEEDRKIGYRPITNIHGRNIAIENKSIAEPEEQSVLINAEGPRNYIEAELTDDEIEEYRKGGYIVEDISVPFLNQRQKGGTEQPVNAANPYWILDEGEPFKVRPADAQLEYDIKHPSLSKPKWYGGRLEESDIDPTDILSLGAGLAKAFGKGVGKALLKSGARRLGTDEGLLSKVRKINPWAENLNNPNKSYRVAGLDAFEDYKNTGVLRSVQQGVPEGASLLERAMSRPTSFPSFQKGYADMRYGNPEGSVVFETGLPTFKRGELNPVTGQQIRGRHYAHRVIDPKTGETMRAIPASDIRVFGDKPHWLKGYPEVPVDLPGSPNAKFNLKAESSIKNKLSDKLKATDSIIQESLGSLFDKKNQKQIDKGNNWLGEWIQHPETQAKIDSDFKYINDRTNNYLGAPLQYIKDEHDIAYSRAKTFKPNSKMYPLKKQFIDYKNNVEPIHTGNYGISYMHHESPYDKFFYENNINKPYEKYGSWISRSPLHSNKTSTTIHEGTHDWTDDFTLTNSLQTKDIINNYTKEQIDDLKQWENLRQKGIEPSTVMGNKKADQAYLSDPTEVHARIMELRKHFNLTPETTTKVTTEEAEKMLTAIKKYKTPIDANFAKVVNNDPDKLKYLFKRLWAVPAVVATSELSKEQKGGVVAKLSQKEIDDYIKQGYIVEEE
jgi:hypothetical protein